MRSPYIPCAPAQYRPRANEGLRGRITTRLGSAHLAVKHQKRTVPYMSSKPAVTIVTAVAPQLTAHIAETVESIAAEQKNSHHGLQWVVVEDGSGATREWLQPLVESLGGTWDCQGAHAGVSAARTRALTHTQCPIVLPLDADDVLAAGVVDALVTAFETQPHVAAVAGVLDRVIGEVAQDDVRTCAPLTERLWGPGELADQWTSPFAFHPNLVAYRLDALLSAGGWPALPGGEDRALVLAVNATSHVLSTSIPILGYRVWDEQTTAGQVYAKGKDTYEKLTWLLTDARLKAARGHGLDPQLPSTSKPQTPA